jgi:gamma-glutamyltranspeptidase/glutathione hydrolase
MVHYIAQFADQYRLWPQNAAQFLPNGRPPAEGELFVQPDLARSIST